MSLEEFSSNLPILSNMDQDEISIKSFSDIYKSHSQTFINQINDECNFNDISSYVNIIETNDISQDELEIYKKVFENDNKTNKAINSPDNIEEKIKNNLEENNTYNINNSNDIFEIKNINDNFNIFHNGNDDNHSNDIIYEVLNDNGNKKPKKFKKVKKLFRVIYSIDSKNTKKTRNKKKNTKKYYTYNIRKKIKAAFHKSLKNEINKKLKKAGSKFFFKALPQSFITSVKKEKNEQILNLTLNDIFIKFNDIKNEYKNVLEYLEKHHDISVKSNFNIIKNMKYENIFNEYLLSKEFKSWISILQKKEEDKYIKNCIIKANNLINFFKDDKKKNKNFISSN